MKFVVAQILPWFKVFLLETKESLIPKKCLLFEYVVFASDNSSSWSDWAGWLNLIIFNLNLHRMNDKSLKNLSNSKLSLVLVLFGMVIEHS